MSREHASCVAIGERGVLLRGPSGAGKSDLAARLIDDGAELVADDQVLLRAARGRVIADPPDELAGMLEVRGVGILLLPCRRGLPLALVVELVASGQVPRLPEPRKTEIEGVALPILALNPFEASTPAKIRLALTAARTDIDCIGGARRTS